MTKLVPGSKASLFGISGLQDAFTDFVLRLDITQSRQTLYLYYVSSQTLNLLCIQGWHYHLIFLPPPAKCWDYNCVPPHWPYAMLRIKLRA